MAASIKTGKSAGAFRVLTIVLTCVAIMPIVLQSVSADDATVQAHDINVERREASGGNRLRWEWQSSSPLVFSITRVLDPGTALYSFNGTSDSASFTVSKGDTYLFLWLNPSNESVTLSFTVHVDANEGSTVIVALAIVLLFAMITAIGLFFLRRKGATANRPTAASGGIGDSSQQRGSAAVPAITDQVSQTGSPSETLPDSVPAVGTSVARTGTAYCPHCGNPVDSSASFCPSCGKRLLAESQRR